MKKDAWEMEFDPQNGKPNVKVRLGIGDDPEIVGDQFTAEGYRWVSTRWLGGAA